MAVSCSSWKSQFLCPKLQRNNSIHRTFSLIGTTTTKVKVSRTSISAAVKFISAVHHDSKISSSLSSSHELEKGSSSTTIIFIKGLAQSTSEKGLKMAFTQFGEVSRVKIIHDKKTEEPLGFAYVWFYEKECAQAAIEEMNGKFFDGRFISVTIASPGSCKPRPKPTPYKF